MRVCSLIMAGGEEIRFGPVKKYIGSKTTLQLAGQEEILLETIFRCDRISNRSDIYIVTNENQYKIYKKIIETKCGEKYNFPKTNFLLEPKPRGTAPCILFSALKIKKRYPGEDIILCVFPSDHDIPNDDKFVNTLKLAVNIAARGKKLVTIGIEPTFPAQAYGYIKYKNKFRNGKAYTDVVIFKEKPKEDAERFFESKKFLWNSGIFVWRLDTILEQFKEHFSDAYNEFMAISNASFMSEELQKIEWIKAYERVKKISIDYAILEETNTENLTVVFGDFEWQDIGKWDALLALFSKDDGITNVEIVGIDKINKTIYSTGKFACLGDTRFTFDFSTNSYVWLHCNEDEKEEIINILSGYGKYKISEFDSIEIDKLINSLSSSVEYKETSQEAEGAPLIFISHKSDDKPYGDEIRDVLISLGVSNSQLIYTDHPLNGVPAGENIYDYLRRHINAKVFMIILWSDKYLESISCLNEMGAAWVTKCEYFNFFVPEFNTRNPRLLDSPLDIKKMAVVLSGDEMCEERMKKFVEKIVEYFGLETNHDREQAILSRFIRSIKTIAEHKTIK